MTDNEIIKAFENMLKNFDGKVSDFEAIASAIDLINGQKAEIERLQTENRILSQKRMNLFEKLDFIEKTRAKAVKEFAERFENELTQIEVIYIDEEHENFISANKVIALLVNLVKEMVGESK